MSRFSVSQFVNVHEMASAMHVEIDKLDATLAKINGIRNSIIGFQKMDWSEHIYPLVAALNEAGIEGMDYPETREYFGTMIERTVAAENSAAAKDAEIARLRGLLAKLETSL